MSPPESILMRILAEKRQELTARKATTPLTALRDRAAPTTRSLRSALAKKGTRFILEHKRASPSKGSLRLSGDARDIAKAYLGAADAISVLTDRPFFGGSFDDLRAMRSVADVPILCKDFVLEPYQVVEARVRGADAVLLMMSVLSDADARACADEARKLGMDALVEVHDEIELGRALALGATVIGINNRDLRTLKIDLALTERLAPLLPGDVVVVAESGIESRRDVDRLAPLVDAFLVGSSLMRASDVRSAARELVFGRVKICGLTSSADAVVAQEKGATFGGIVFAHESPRRVSESRAHEIGSRTSLPLVGVFVNAAIHSVVAVARSLGLSAVQLHGDENAKYVDELRATLTPECAIWCAAHVGPGNRLVADSGTLRSSDRIVFDAASADVRGGTGRSFDWDIVASHERIGASLLAGGIGPDNAVRARAVGAYAIDVSSRVESSPGRKNPALVASLFDNLRGEGRLYVGGRHARA